jgi:hypothetical protein
MRRFPSLLAAFGLAACASTPVVRMAPVPLGLPTSAVEAPRVRADADHGAAPAGSPSPFVHDPAVRALYDSAPPPASAVEPATEPAPDDGAAAMAAPSSYGWQPAPVVPPRRAPFVPVATFVGAGVGSALSRCGHRAEGALLGAGIGLLFDLGRLAR